MRRWLVRTIPPQVAACVWWVAMAVITGVLVSAWLYAASAPSAGSVFRALIAAWLYAGPLRREWRHAAEVNQLFSSHR